MYTLIFYFQLSQYVTDPQLQAQHQRSYLTLQGQAQGQGHVISNPYQYNNYGEDLHDGLAATLHLRDSVYMSPQLVKLTNTLRSKKKSCQGAHPGSEAAGPGPSSAMTSTSADEVVFRAVSPHGHVYWEIDPSRQDKLRSSTCFENIPNPLMEQHEAIYGSSRQSSSRYSDNHPLISAGSADGSNQNNGGTVLVNPFADVQLLPSASPLHQHYSPQTPSPGQMRPELRFSSLRGFNQSFAGQQQQQQQGSPGKQVNHSTSNKLFTNRSASARAAKMRDIAKQIEHMRILQQQQKESPASSGTTINTTASGSGSASGCGGHSGSSGSTSPSSTNHVPEQVQQQVQIKDLKTVPVSVAPSSDHILTKIQNAMSDSIRGSSNSPKQRKL